MRPTVLAALVAASLALGCVTPPERPLPLDHPANPNAAPSEVAPISSTLDVATVDPIPGEEINR